MHSTTIPVRSDQQGRSASAESIRTPAEHVQAQRLADRPSLQQEVRRKLPGKIGDVEDGRQPRILLADEVGVFDQPEDGLGADRRFVGLLDAVAEPHQREEKAIDLA